MESILSHLQILLRDPTIRYQQIILTISLIVGTFETWIGSRQKPYLNPLVHPMIPSSLLPYLPSEQAHTTFLKSQQYAADTLAFKGRMGMLDQLESFILLTSVAASTYVYLGLGHATSTPWPFLGKDGTSWTLLKGFWDLSARLIPASFATTEIRHSMAFVLLLTTLGTLTSLPKAYYKNFVLEENHGFNKMTRQTFFADQVKGYFLSIALELPILAGILSIIQRVGDAGMVQVVGYIMGFILAIQLIMIPLYPNVIAPMFNTFTPLPETSPVYPRIKSLAAKLNFPLGQIWVIDGSKRSAHSNAYFYGLPFLTKQIVIFDTLLEKASPEEVEAILAHELGHWHGSHVLILLGTALVQTAFTLSTFILFLNNASLLSAFGFPTSALSSTAVPTLISLLLAANLFTPLSAVLQLITNSITRALEYNADNFAVKLGPTYAKNLKGALVRIHEDNLAIYGVDWIYSMYNNNHPTLTERLQALDTGISGIKDGKAVEEKKEL